MAATRQLGRTGITISPIGMGCMQFAGRGLSARFFPAMAQNTVNEVVAAALVHGVTWFDSAENYGHGTSEQALSTALRAAGVSPGALTIATKWSPIGRTAASIDRTIGDRLNALEPFPIDLYQVHFGFGSLSSTKAQMRAMARLVEQRKIAAVGVSNFTARQMERADAVLADHGIPLASNQIQLNLLYRSAERNGVLETARRLGVTLIAYSPLRQGVLTGRFHADPTLISKLPLARRAFMGITAATIKRTTPLIEAMRAFGEAHNATVAQIALAWLIQNYGDTVVAIPGASKPHHAQEAAGAQNIHLSSDELARLNDLSKPPQKR